MKIPGIEFGEEYFKIPGIEFDKKYFEMTLSKPWVFLFAAETFFVAGFLIKAIVSLF